MTLHPSPWNPCNTFHLEPLHTDLFACLNHFANKGMHKRTCAHISAGSKRLKHCFPAPPCFAGAGLHCICRRCASQRTAAAAATAQLLGQLPQLRRSCWGSCCNYSAAAAAETETEVWDLQQNTRVDGNVAKTHTHSSNIFHIMFSLL